MKSTDSPRTVRMWRDAISFRSRRFPIAARSGFRLAPARNNQRIGVNWADDYDLTRLNWEAFGAIAQLGERLDGIQKVAGSSPAGSIPLEGWPPRPAGEAAV